MPQAKQASKQKRKNVAVKVLGAAGLSFSLVGNASASTTHTAGIPQSDNTHPIGASFLATRKWPTSVLLRSTSSTRKTFAEA